MDSKPPSRDDLVPQSPPARKGFSAGRVDRDLVVLHLRADFPWRGDLDFKFTAKGARKLSSSGGTGGQRGELITDSDHLRRLTSRWFSGLALIA